MIEAFRAVILNGSISAAANVMHISQPAVSRLIRDLEAEIGFALFERRHGRVFANEDALELYEEVHYAYIGMRRIAEAADQIRRRESGVLRVASMPAVGLSIMPEVIARFRARHPKIFISLEVVRSVTAIQFLTALRSDIGFLEASYGAPSLERGPRFDLETVCILPRDHRLLANEVLTPEDLENEAFVSLGADSQTRTKIDAVFEAAGVSRQALTEAPLSSVICSLVRQGCGLSIVDPLSAAEFKGQGLDTRPFRPAIGFSFRALATSRLVGTKLLQEFYSLFEETMTQALES